MPKPTQVLVVISQANVLMSVLKQLQKSTFDTITASELDAALEILEKQKPAFAFFDSNLPYLKNQETDIKAFTDKETKVALITSYREKEWFDDAVQKGINGFVFNQNIQEEIKNCIRAFENNEDYISEELLLIYNLDIKEKEQISTLTHSERIILLHIALNQTTPQIAEKLFISKKTVEKHRSNISKKLNLSGKTNSLLLWAKENIKQHD